MLPPLYPCRLATVGEDTRAIARNRTGSAVAKQVELRLPQGLAGAADAAEIVEGGTPDLNAGPRLGETDARNEEKQDEQDDAHDAPPGEMMVSDGELILRRLPV